MSVRASSSTERVRMRATSTATLPLPTTTPARPQGRIEVAVVGMAVVPPDKCRCRMASWQVLAGNAQTPVALGAGREQDLVVMRQDLLQGRSAPNVTFPKKRKPGRAAVFSNWLMTAFVFSWSGATPPRTRPYGVGSRSNRSTVTARPGTFSSSSVAKKPDGPAPKTAIRNGFAALPTLSLLSRL